uniref:Uncharacterized protein n=1 Tax=Macaca fascicularis TaxID=9541 RepID=A0A7N9CFK5_MACFA
CWKFWLGQSEPANNSNCVTYCVSGKNISRVHVHNVQVCYIGIHVPCWFAAPINSLFTFNSSFSSY